jgi:hypothetical protein
MPTVAKPRIAPNSSGARNAPFINLEDAIQKTRILYQKANRNAIHLSVAAGYLGYSPKASSFTLIISALKKYGLALDEGSSEGRRVKVSDLGLQIVADSRDVSPHREERIKHAALLPKAHRELWEEFGSGPPDTKALEVYLTLEKAYTQEAARSVVKVYLATILYAGLNEGGILGDVAADDAGTDSAVPQRIADARTTMDSRNSAPEWIAPAGNSPVRTLSIPLKGSRTFDLRFPTDLSKDDFDFIVQNMKLWERQIVATGE